MFLCRCYFFLSLSVSPSLWQSNLSKKKMSFDQLKLERAEDFDLVHLTWMRPASGDKAEKQMACATYDRRNCYLRKLSVAREEQNKGVGTRFLAMVEKQMQSDGCGSCTLTAMPPWTTGWDDLNERDYEISQLKRFYRTRGYHHVDSWWARLFLPNPNLLVKNIQKN